MTRVTIDAPEQASTPDTVASGRRGLYPKSDGWYSMDDAGNESRIGPRHNFSATVAPDADNDVDEGYSIGSIWIDITGQNAYICEDASDGAANWLQIDGAGGSGATTELDNLGTVAINTSLISDTNVTDDLGSSGVYWRTAYIQSVLTAALNWNPTSTTIVVATGDVDLTGITADQRMITIAAESGTSDVVTSFSNGPAAPGFFILRPDTGDTISFTHDGSTVYLLDENAGGTFANNAKALAYWDGAAMHILTGDFARSSHNHAASDINSGTLAHERGGIEADISAVAEGDILGGTGTGSIGIIAASGASDGDVPTIQADGSLAFEAPPGAAGAANKFACQGRLTLTTGVPVTTSDVTAATTLYFTPYKGNIVTLWGGSDWDEFTLTELSISIPATTDTNYDVFVYDNTGLTLELVAWTDGTNRATALDSAGGTYVQTTNNDRLYIGTVRTTGVSGQCEDSEAKRFVWNYYNRVERHLKVVDTTDTWSYTTATFRAANNSTANRVAFVRGLNEEPVNASVHGSGYGTNVNMYVGIDVDGTSANDADITTAPYSDGTIVITPSAHLSSMLGVGYHFLQWIERGGTGGVFYGDAGAAFIQSGLQAYIQG